MVVVMVVIFSDVVLIAPKANAVLYSFRWIYSHEAPKLGVSMDVPINNIVDSHPSIHKYVVRYSKFDVHLKCANICL